MRCAAFLAVAVLWLGAAVPAAGATEAGPTPERIGQVRGDTLLVSLDRVIDAALAHNEMLAAAAAMSDAAGADALGAWRDLSVMCRVNGKERQHGRASDMVFGIPFVIAYISHIMTLEAGDLIATGSPSGVGPLEPGDVVEVEIPGVGVLRNPVEARSA